MSKEKLIWTRKPSSVSSEEYNAHYKELTGDVHEPAAHTHVVFEGQLEFTMLLYIPKRAPVDMFSPGGSKNGVQLYVHHVRVGHQDVGTALVPEWLSFLRGVVDTDDLPQNFGLENKILRILRRNLVKRAIGMFQELEAKSELAYLNFYTAFSKNIKLGIHEDTTNRTKLAKFLRFYTSTSGDTMVSLDDYVSRMPSQQSGIFYITGESREMVAQSPFLEALRQRGYEVLFMVDPIDEYAVQQLKEYQGRPLVSITQGDLDLGFTQEEKLSQEAEAQSFDALCARMSAVLGDKVEKVVISQRVVDSPCVLVTGQFGWSANMERIMKAQALRDSTMASFMVSKKTMEVNPKHKLIRGLKTLVGDPAADQTALDALITLLFNTALLTSGFSLDTPKEFAGHVHRLMCVDIAAMQNPASQQQQQHPPSSHGKDTSSGTPHISTWDIANTEAWLSSLGPKFAPLAALCGDAFLDGKGLLSLTLDDIKEAAPDLSNMVAKGLLRRIHALQEEKQPASETDACTQFSRATDLGWVLDEDLAPFHGIRKQKEVDLATAVKPYVDDLAIDSDLFVALQKGRKIARKKQLNPHGLTKDMVAAIFLYICQSAFYPTLNMALRSAAREKAKRLFPYLKLLLSAMDRLPRIKGTVWRGMRVTPGQLKAQQKTAGEVIADLKEKQEEEDFLVWWSPTSCTTDMEKSVEFTGGKQCSDVRVLFNVECKRGVAIERYSAIPEEAEVLLPPGSAFLVKNVSEVSDGLWIAQVEEQELKRDLVA